MTKTTTPQVKIVNCETGEEIIRDANEAEIAEMQSAKLSYEARQSADEAKATAKAALLTQLGITAEQAKLLLS